MTEADLAAIRWAANILISQALDAAAVVEEQGKGWANQIRESCDALNALVERAVNPAHEFSRIWSRAEPWQPPGYHPAHHYTPSMARTEP